MARSIEERRRERRVEEERRRGEARRRGLLLLGGLAVVVAAAVLALSLLSGDDASDGPPTASEAGAGQAGAGPEQSTGGLQDNPPLVTDFHAAVPILMYHAISPPPPGAPLPDLFVPEAEFEAQMKWLAEHDYNGVTLEQVFSAWDDGHPIARNPIVISFDDGLQSQYVGARPMLDRLGWPGVLNLALSHLESGDMTPAEVRTLIDSGWELDSHTIDHLDLTTLDPTQLAHQVADSRTELQQQFKVGVDFFCYPSGAYDAAAVQAVEDAGYLGATTTDPGLASPDQPYTLKRIRVEPGDGAGGVGGKAELGVGLVDEVVAICGCRGAD